MTFNCFKNKLSIRNNKFNYLPDDVIINIMQYFYLPFKIKKNFNTINYYSEWQIKDKSIIQLLLAERRLYYIGNKPTLWKFY